MKLLISIDDTDNIESQGSGELLEIMGKELTERGIGHPGPVVNYQLLNREDIPCTTCNSTSCSEWIIEEECFGEVVSLATNLVAARCAADSNPGLCIIKIEELTDDMARRLTAYGKCAKTMILRKWEACKLAESMPEQICLSEHGGTGEGIIGALAGCGLQLSELDERNKHAPD